MLDAVTSRLVRELVFKRFAVIKTSAPNPMVGPSVLRLESVVWELTVSVLANATAPTVERFPNMTVLPPTLKLLMTFKLRPTTMSWPVEIVLHADTLPVKTAFPVVWKRGALLRADVLPT